MAQASSTSTETPRMIRAGGAPEGFDATLLLRRPQKATPRSCMSPATTSGPRRWRARWPSSTPRCRSCAFPAGIACPMTACRPTRRSRPRGWRRWRPSRRGCRGAFILLTTLNAATQYVPPRDLLRASAFVADGRRAHRRGGAARLPRADGLRADADGDGTRRLRGARRHHRRLAAGGADAGAARPLRRRAGRRAPLRRGHAADHRNAGTGRACAGLRGHPRRGRDHAVPAELPHRVRRGGTDDPLYEAVSAGRKHQGRSTGCRSSTTGWRRSSTTCRARRSRSTTRPRAQRIARWEAIADQYDTRATALSQKGRLDTVYKPVPPGQLYLDEAAWDAALGARRVVQFSPLRAIAGPGRDRRGRARGPRFRARTAEREPEPFRGLGGSSSGASGEGTVVVASWSEGARERLKGLLEDRA
jgi:transcription-repair coupling factor (superfamily II helicase)